MVFADVAKLVDALDLGSSAARHGGSSPSIRTCPPKHGEGGVSAEALAGVLFAHMLSIFELTKMGIIRSLG